MKIAFLTFAHGEYCVTLANALARYVEVSLLAPGSHTAAHVGRLSPEVLYRPYAKPRMRQVWRQPAMLYQILRDIRRFDPDVIHMQHGYLWFNPLLPLLRRYPLVVTIHDPRFHLGDWESRKTPQAVIDYGFRQATQIIVHTPQMKQIAMDDCRIPESKLNVVPHPELGVPPQQPRQPDTGQPQVLFFGRIWEYKGLEYLIRAEPLVTTQVPNVQFVIAGTGEDFDRYRQMMVHPERFVVHNEYIPAEQVPDFFGRATVIALPYIEATQSGVVATAYTYGTAVVATTVGGLPAQVEHGRTGLLVPPRDERALAEAIITLLHDHELRQRLVAGGRLRNQTEFSADVVAKQTIDVYQQAVSLHQAGGVRATTVRVSK